ncbi:MAG: hypothetical protein F6J87_16970, partial [Spirulina sp. SIO3F2]|nr:hypothetical protein [Spirulina sp. SIO3F2]
MTDGLTETVFKLPAAAQNLTEPESIAIAQAIQAVPILTPSSPDPVQTPYVHQAGEKPPILLLSNPCSRR